MFESSIAFLKATQIKKDEPEFSKHWYCVFIVSYLEL